MSVAAMIQGLTSEQFADLVSDFRRVLERVREARGRGGRAAAVLSPRKYLAVLRTLGVAEAAARRGEEADAHFFKGVAAAFYGLVRLADARQLEDTLGPALGLTDAAKGVDGKTGKEVAVAQIEQTQFSFEDLCSFFENAEVRFTVNHEEGMLTTGFRRDLGPVFLTARVSEECRLLQFRFALPVPVPEDRRTEMALAVTRANYGLLMGFFEMDLADGELNYKIAIPIDDTSLSKDQLDHCMGAAFANIDRYVPAFHRVGFADASAEEAIADVEGRREPEPE